MSCPRKKQPQIHETALRPLSHVHAGECVRIASIQAGCRAMASRLAAMGLLVNVELTVVNNAHPGPFVVSVRDSKIVLGWGMADKIMVV